jgi:hypothetical protein
MTSGAMGSRRSGWWRWVNAALLVFGGALAAAGWGCTSAAPAKDDPDARPPVTADDVKIVQRAESILDSEAKWNRADDRKCPEGAQTFSLYCALERATDEVSGTFAHRGAAMQEARFVIDDVAPNRKTYHHRLMDYNNDPTTTFANVQDFFRRLEDRLRMRLQEQSAGSSH